ncbi:hypothetical protein Tco_0871785 [Tanacetum coccineum]
MGERPVEEEGRRVLSLGNRYILVGRMFRKKDGMVEWMNLTYFLEWKKMGKWERDRWKKRGDTCVVTGKKHGTVEWMNLTYFLEWKKMGKWERDRWKKRGDMCVVTGWGNALEKEDVYGFVVMEICFGGKNVQEEGWDEDTLQQASTSGTQSDNAPIYDSDGSIEVPKDENCYDHDTFNMLTHEVHYTDLQIELDRTKEKLENCIIKKEKEYTVLWNNWYTKCEECKFDKISYDKAYNDMQQKIERLQAQLGDLNGKSSDT